MTQNEIMTNLFGFSQATYYSWKKENRKIIKLLDRFFDKNDLEEFIVYNRCSKFEYLEELENEIFEDEKNFIKFFSEIKIEEERLYLFFCLFYFAENGTFLERIFDYNKMKEDFNLTEKNIKNILNMIEKNSITIKYKTVIRYSVKNQFKNLLKHKHISDYGKKNTIDLFIEYNLINNSNPDIKFNNKAERDLILSNLKIKYDYLDKKYSFDINDIKYLDKETKKLKDEFETTIYKEYKKSMIK